MPQSRRRASRLIAVALTIVTGAALGQSAPGSRPEAPVVREAPGEFQFVRLAYSANQYGRGRGGGWGRQRQMWQTDWPDAEEHFTRGVERSEA